MQPALLIRLRPAGPWRYGPGDGGEDRMDAFYRSDRLFSAVTLAIRQLGALEEWLDATVNVQQPLVAFSSLFPYQGDTLFAPPPTTIWPPPASLIKTSSPVFLSKIRWRAAQFVPLSLIESILTGQPVVAEQWMPDAESGCLLRRDRPSASPFRNTIRSAAAVDRMGRGAVQIHSSACVEFESGSGLWCCARFRDTETESNWSGRLKACFRLLADSGFGGRRSSGWGQAETPEFEEGTWPALLMPKLARLPRNGSNNGESPMFWLLSLYSPASNDRVDWSAGDYRLTIRGGRVESSCGFGAKKKTVQMVAEGSVVASRNEPVGTAIDVAPDDFAHRVYRNGFALALELPKADLPDLKPIEAAAEEEAPEPLPCAEIETDSSMEESVETPEEIEVPVCEI